MSVLVVAEKPSVARDIAAVLGATTKRHGFYEGAGYNVTWAFGHLVRLADPEEINPRWRWCWEALPMLPERFPLFPRSAGAETQLKVIRKLLRDRSRTGLVCATDAGREGELIFRYIIQALGYEGPFKRLWVSSLTPEAIRQGFENLVPGSRYDSLAEAARLRSEADWLVGMNFTRAYRLATGCKFTVGRVQTPTLAMIVERDAAIRAHTPRPYFNVAARFACAAGEWTATYVRSTHAPTGEPQWDARLWPATDARARPPEDDAEAVCSRARAGVATLQSVQRECKSYRPDLLFDLTSLQRTANALWGWSASRTLDVAQELYEKHKMLSYPRTDSRHLSASVAATLAPIVELVRAPYEGLIAADTGRGLLGRRFVDDAQVRDHHAIIPTPTVARLAEGSDAARLYDLVCRRLLAAWQPDYVEAVTEMLLEIRTGDRCDRYVAHGTQVEALGWRKLEPRPSVPRERAVELPAGLQAGESVTVQDVTLLRKQTRAPKHHSEATLLSAMESAGAQLTGEASEAMRERGLGTPSTRASIIEGLVARGYVVRDGKALRATSFGEQLIASVHESLKNAALTGDWEARLRRVERRAERPGAFRDNVRVFVADVVREVRLSRSRASLIRAGLGVGRTRT